MLCSVTGRWLQEGSEYESKRDWLIGVALCSTIDAEDASQFAFRERETLSHHLGPQKVRLGNRTWYHQASNV